MPDTPEEFNEFLFGPKNNPDGHEPTDDDEKRRLQQQRMLIERAAREAGIEVTLKGDHPPGPTQSTERSKQIVEIARPMMEEADDGVRTSFQQFKIECPDGSKISYMKFQLGVLDDLGKAVKALAESPDKIVEIARVVAGTPIRLCVSVGRFIRAKAGVGERDGSDEAPID
ncbi:MAG: hypothetical protein AAGA55_01075 [Planctomycetota bacterium]